MGESEFDLRYESAKVVKGQIMANFITHHHGSNIGYVELMPWRYRYHHYLTPRVKF